MTDKNKISLTILGSGTFVTSLERSSSSVLIETGGKKILVDSGPGTLRRLLETGFFINNIDIILYTHLHPDHTSELIPILFSTKYGEKRDKNLTIYASNGFKNFHGKLNDIYSNWLNPDNMEIKELSPGEQVDFNSFKISTSRVIHHPSSIAYRIENSDRSVVISGDTDYSEDLIKLSENCDLLITECSHPDSLKMEGHLSPSFAGKMAEKASVKNFSFFTFTPGVKRLILKKKLEKLIVVNLLWAGIY